MHMQEEPWNDDLIMGERHWQVSPAGDFSRFFEALIELAPPGSTITS